MIKTKANKLYFVLFFTIALFSCKKEYVPYIDYDDPFNRIIGIYDCSDNHTNSYQIELVKKYTAKTPDNVLVDTFFVKNLFNRFPTVEIGINKSFTFVPNLYLVRDKQGLRYTFWLQNASDLDFNKLLVNPVPVRLNMKVLVDNKFYFLSDGVELKSELLYEMECIKR